MRESHFGQMIGVIRLLSAPVLESASEPVDSDTWVQFAQQHQKTHVAERAATTAAGKNEITYTYRCHPPYDGDCAVTERNAVLEAALHAVAGDGPNTVLQVNLVE